MIDKIQVPRSDDLEVEIPDKPINTFPPFSPTLNFCFIEVAGIKISLQSGEPIAVLRKHAEAMLEKINLKPGVTNYAG